MESLSWNSIVVLLQHGSIPWVTVFKECIIPGSLPHGVKIPVRKPAPVCAPLPGLHFISCQELIQHDLSLRCNFFWGTFTHCGIRSSLIFRVDICSTEILRGLQGITCFAMVFSLGRWGPLLLCLEHLFFLLHIGLGICSFSHICSQLQHSFLTYNSPELPPELLMALALAGRN